MIWLAAVLLAATPIQWQSDWNAAFNQAKAQHKLVFVHYTQTPCAKCVDVNQLAEKDPLLAKALSDFVVLRVNVANTSIPAVYRHQSPGVAIFDAGKRERFRVDDVNGELRGYDWHFTSTSFSEPINAIHAASSAFVKANELFDAKRDLEADFLLATTYHRLRMTEHARAAYADAKKVAEREHNAALAQSADVQSAYTFVTDGRAAHAVELLKPLTKTAVNRDTEALIWLTLGHAYEAATDKKEAADAFRRADSLAAANTRTKQEAAAALKRME